MAHHTGLRPFPLPALRRILSVAIGCCSLLAVGSTLAQRPAPVPIPIPGPTPKPGSASAVGRAFNFTPITRDIMQDGFPTPTVMFRDGDHYIRINLPTGWKAAGSSNEIHFDNATLPGALITIRLSSLAAPEKFDDAWIDTIKPLLLSSVPQDSKNGRIANITPNALNIAGWTSIEMKIVYDQVGKSMVNDWMFLKLADGRLLEVISTGKDQNFTVIRAATAYVLAGWGVVPASMLKP